MRYFLMTDSSSTSYLSERPWPQTSRIVNKSLILALKTNKVYRLQSVSRNMFIKTIGTLFSVILFGGNEKDVDYHVDCACLYFAFWIFFVEFVRLSYITIAYRRTFSLWPLLCYYQTEANIYLILFKLLRYW